MSCWDSGRQKSVPGRRARGLGAGEPGGIRPHARASEGPERAGFEEARLVDPAPEWICRPRTRSRAAPQPLSWRSERRSRTTVRSVVLPNSQTPTAWWPSEAQRTSIVCSRVSSPMPFPWCTHPSPAAESSGACVWVRRVEDAEGHSEAL